MNIYILAREMASPGNRHCASCIGTLSFPTLLHGCAGCLCLTAAVVGCGELSASRSPGAWFRYSDDSRSVDVGCRGGGGGRGGDGRARWRLECRDGRWTGHLGNCSATSPSLSAGQSSTATQFNSSSELRGAFTANHLN